MHTTADTNATSTTLPELNQREIERLVERGGRFLRAIGTRPAIMRELAAAGYNLKEHHQGWELFLKVCGYNPVAPGDTARSVAQLAIDELDAWDGPAFARAAAALGRLYPDQNQFLFDGLEPQTGITAVASCKTFLDRVAAMRSGKAPVRDGHRKEDKAAVTLLEQRGIISSDIEEHMRGLIDQAMQLTQLPPPDNTREAEVQVAAQQLKAWLDDWRATAAVIVSRRDYLISLGLASRRPSSTDPEENDAATPAPITTAPPRAPSPANPSA